MLKKLFISILLTACLCSAQESHKRAHETDKITLDTSKKIKHASGFLPANKTVLDRYIPVRALQKIISEYFDEFIEDARSEKLNQILCQKLLDSKLFSWLWSHEAARTKPTIASFAFSPDGKHLAVSQLDNKVSIIDLSTLTICKKFDHGKDHTGGIAYSPDGKYLAVGKSSKSIDIWNLATSEIAQVIVCKSVTHSGCHLVNPMLQDTALTCYRMHPKSCSGLPTTVAFSPDGNSLAYQIGYKSDRIEIYDFKANSHEDTLLTESNYPHHKTFAYVPDNKRITTVVEDGGEFIVHWNISQRRPMGTAFGGSHNTNCLSYSLDHKYLATCTLSKIYILDVENCDSIAYTIDLPPRERPYILALSVDNNHLFWGSSQGLKIWTKLHLVEIETEKTNQNK